MFDPHVQFHNVFAQICLHHPANNHAGAGASRFLLVDFVARFGDASQIISPKNSRWGRIACCRAASSQAILSTNTVGMTMGCFATVSSTSVRTASRISNVVNPDPAVKPHQAIISLQTKCSIRTTRANRYSAIEERSNQRGYPCRIRSRNRFLRRILLKASTRSNNVNAKIISWGVACSAFSLGPREKDHSFALYLRVATSRLALTQKLGSRGRSPMGRNLQPAFGSRTIMMRCIASGKLPLFSHLIRIVVIT